MTSPPERPKPTQSASAGPLTVLVAEDNQVNQALIRRILENRGYMVVLAANGQEAVDMTAQARFDLIFMDVQMPKLDGLRAVARIRDMESDTPFHVPVVAMTAQAQPGDREDCLAAGMDAYVAKPFNAAQVYAVIDELLSSQTDDAAKESAPGAVDPTAGENEPVLDRADALARLGDDESLLAELAAVLLETMPPSLAAIHAAVENGDADGLRESAHSLKGAAQNLSARAVAERARALEEAGRSRNLRPTFTLLVQLEKEIDRLRPELAKMTG
jgi:CheY-like chemotaxis protein